MKYCSRCKEIYFSDGDKCECGKKFAKKFDFDVPVKLVTVSHENKSQIEMILSKADIPYSEQDNSGYSPSVGKISGEVDYLVPLGFLKKGIDLLSENGFVEKPEWYDSLEIPEDYIWEEMPEGKRRVVQIFSIIAFILLIYICVAGADILAAKFAALIGW